MFVMRWVGKEREVGESDSPSFGFPLTVDDILVLGQLEKFFFFFFFFCFGHERDASEETMASEREKT
jgi:hypothetical protein